MRTVGCRAEWWSFAERLPERSRLLFWEILVVTVVLGSVSHAAEMQPADGVSDGRRFYATGLVASSVQNVVADSVQRPGTSPVNLLGCGAMGVSMPLPSGAIRFELEGRSNTFQVGERSVSAAGTDRPLDQRDRRHPTSVNTTASGWTTTVNAWRDVSLPADFGLYAGGGIGLTAVANSDQSPVEAASGFAWQAGGGVTYAAHERVTIDVGYRLVGAGFANRSSDSLASPVGEATISLRFFEPFSRWLSR